MPGKETEPTRESEQSEYKKAVRYSSDHDALTVYNRTQAIIFAADCDLSSYRIRYQEIPHVIVLGETPPPRVDQALVTALKDGIPTDLPDDVWRFLIGRRVRANRIGPWVERHFR